MATASVPNTFANNSGNADATQVNANFTALVNFINTNLIQKDGSVTFTGIPTLPGTDPSSANHATRKGYVDAFALTGVLAGTLSSPTFAAGAITNAAVNASAAIAASKLAGVLVNGTGTNATVTISTSAPSGGSDGDIWFKY